MHVIIIGGGYAGLAAAISLRKKNPHVAITLFDKKNFFLKKTYLHKTVHQDIRDFQLPYPELASRFNISFYNEEINLNLQRLAKEKALLSKTTGIMPFDYLIIATGSTEYIPFSLSGQNYRTLGQIMQGGLKENLEKLPRGSEITVVGAGATGIQFLFEIFSHFGKKFSYKLIHYGELILDNQIENFHREILFEILKNQIAFYPNRKVLEIREKEMKVENRETNKIEKINSDFFLVFTGVLPSPQKFVADSYGRLLVNQEVIDFIFVAGDCSYFSSGENSLTAQVAVRKGKLVAENVISSYTRKNLQKFNFQELGYFVSLGKNNACGYLFHKNLFLKGPLAFAIKEFSEKQFDLFLQGIDILL